MWVRGAQMKQMHKESMVRLAFLSSKGCALLSFIQVVQLVKLIKGSIREGVM